MIEGFFADSAMPRLYAAATHYISMSFGEGWDQPMLEAAASGLRLIAPAQRLHRVPGFEHRHHAAQPCGAGEVCDRSTAAFFDGANWWQTLKVE
jgi:hypothetical protein